MILEWGGGILETIDEELRIFHIAALESKNGFPYLV
jgi:hypothetical protein